MTITYWAPNAATIAQVETGTVTAVANNATITATINAKTISYTCVVADTTTTAATNFFNLLNASTVPAEFSEITFANPSNGVITATAKVPGTPFANVPGTSAGLVFSAAGGAAISQVHTTSNSSPSDVNNANNWNRGGSAAIPANGDDVVVGDSSVAMLWNLDQLAAVQFNSYNRWQSFTGTIGLPENNPLGYMEWRATYFKFAGNASPIQVVLGLATTGSGPQRERYNFGSQQVAVTVLGMGSPLDDFGVRLLGTNTGNAMNILAGSVGVAVLPGDTSNVGNVTLDGNATLAFGPGVTWTAATTLTTNGGRVTLNTAPPTITAANGTTFTFGTTGLTYATVTAQGGCRLNFLAGGTITTLTLQTSTILDKSSDSRGLTITNSTIDGDSCQVIDPLNAITWTNATTVKGQVRSGPFQFTGSRTVKVT
jgi:hypothetical protein